MFYVSNITGAIVPFDPTTTSISSPSQASSQAAQVTFAAEISATTATNQVAATDVASGIQAAAATTSEQIQEATVYDGHAIISGRDRIGAGDPINVGRAGAMSAYRIQESEHGAGALPPEMIERVGSVQRATGIDDDAGRSSQRVNPIKQANYRYQAPAKERKRAVVASDIMSSPVFCLQDDLPFEEAERIFKERQFRHVPVLSANRKLVGILSDRDFFGAVSHPSSAGKLIKDRMVTNILTARPQTEIGAIAQVMISHRIGCLPILDQKGGLVGILTRSDILRAIVNHAPIELWT